MLRKSSNSSKSNDELGIGSFIAGCFLIPFALVLLWKNEKKLVTFSKFMTEGRKAVREINCESVDDTNEFELVHMTGTAINMVELLDSEFGIKVPNSYRLKRKVEMYQWKEHCHEDEDTNKKSYSYEQVWSEERINSAIFHHSEGHQNPAVEWPFTSKTFEAPNVNVGKFHLNSSQISRLGCGRKELVVLAEVVGQSFQHCNESMQRASFKPFEIQQNTLISTALYNEQKQGLHVGQIRVTFEYDTCGPVTIIAQQVQNNEGQNTFRKWNPKKLKVPFAESIKEDKDLLDEIDSSCCFYYICNCVDFLCNNFFEEVVDHVVDQHITSKDYFDLQDIKMRTAACIIRPLGIILTCIGFYLLFSPIIALLNWIPLVGFLLGGIVAIAAAIFAFVVGTVLSVLVIAISWVLYRPLIGCILLTAVGLGIFLIFFFPKGEVHEDVTSAAAAD